MQELDDFLAKAKQIPPAPHTLPRLMEILNDPDADTSQAVELITYDAGLTASLLKICNSAQYAGSEKSTTVDEAVLRLGFQEIYRLVASVSAGQLMQKVNPAWGLDSAALWSHSVTAAIAAQLVARDVQEDVSLAFTSGLMHDLGKVIMACALEHIYGSLVQQAAEAECTLLATEKRLLGLHHAEIGGRLLARWHFPEPMVQVVTCHHDPLAAPAPLRRVVACVYLGNLIAYFVGRPGGVSVCSLGRCEESLKVLGLTGDRLPFFVAQTWENAAMVEMLVRLKA